jgi:hypothetical protein
MPTAEPRGKASADTGRNGKPPTLEELARHKRLPVAFLESLGVHDVQRRGVGIPYYDAGGAETIAVKVRIGLGKDAGQDPYDRRSWPAGVPVAAYGQWRLDQATRKGFLVLVEGETDCWALWHHELPALGLPGADMAGKLEREHVACVGRVYVHREPDQAGQKFVDKVVKRLRQLDFEGQVLEVCSPGGVKDPSELHARDPETFRERFQAALRAATPKDEKESSAFPRPIPSSELKASTGATWLWHGCLSRGGITLLSALWKSGKTTLLAALLKAFQTGGTFCGLDIAPARVLFVTEESEAHWADRRDKLGLEDHIRFLIRPFKAKPAADQWHRFLDYLGALCQQAPTDLIVFDCLANLWPVRDENDASQVQAALMPLHQVSEQAGLFLVHHNRKGDGEEATACRGSGALTAFVDTILELRRFNVKDRADRKRILTGYGRYDETPEELVIELTEEGTYVGHGTRHQVNVKDLTNTIALLLPNEPPGDTIEVIVDKWPEDSKPGRQKLLESLRAGADRGDWRREGEGRRGSPFTFWIDAPG